MANPRNLANIAPNINSSSTGSIVLKGASTSANGVGITFPATQSASTDSNTLDDYEEGTWTPVIGGSGGESGQTYTTTYGIYTKIGRLVVAQARVEFTAKGTISGAFVQLKGLPFNVQTVVSDTGQGSAMFINLASGKITVGLQMNLNDTFAYVTGISASTATMTYLSASDLGNNTLLGFTFSYMTYQ